MSRSRKKFNWKRCEGVNRRTGKLLPGYRALHRGRCPIAVISAISANSASKNKVPFVDFDYVSPVFIPGPLGFWKRIPTIRSVLSKLPRGVRKLPRPSRG